MKINSRNITMLSIVISCVAIFIHNVISFHIDYIFFVLAIISAVFSIYLNIRYEDLSNLNLNKLSYFQHITFWIVGIMALVSFLLNFNNKLMMLLMPILSLFVLLFAYRLNLYSREKCKVRRQIFCRTLSTITANIVMIYILSCIILPLQLLPIISLIFILLWIFIPYYFSRSLSHNKTVKNGIIDEKWLARHDSLSAV